MLLTSLEKEENIIRETVKVCKDNKAECMQFENKFVFGAIVFSLSLSLDFHGFFHY
jgi:hypothetical protein